MGSCFAGNEGFMISLRKQMPVSHNEQQHAIPNIPELKKVENRKNRNKTNISFWFNN